MAERTSYAAIRAYLNPLRRAIACVTPAILDAPGSQPSSGSTIDVLLYRGEPMRMRGPERIHLRVRPRVRLTQAIPPRGLWDAQTAAYEYRLSNQDDREILAYHWTPKASPMS